MNNQLLKRLFEVRPIFAAAKQLSTSQADTPHDIFKCYSDQPINFADKYKPLTAEDYNRFISRRSAKREPALTRQITSLAYKVGKRMLSLAEGMPNEEVFPFDRLQLDLKAGGSLVLEGAELATALQYVPTQGLPELITSLREFQEALHRPPPLPTERDVMSTHGAQHAIYQCCELLVEPGDPVLVTQYCYAGLHAALKPYDPEILGIPEDADGINPETLEAVLADRLSQGLKMPKMLYVIPTGNNPTGTVIPEERRRQIYELACRYDFLIVEDDPYMFLNYADEALPSFLSLDACGRVLRLDSLSKVVSAGLRAGWVSAPAPLLHRLQLHMQAELLHSCTLSQAILVRLLRDRRALVAHLRAARALYGARRAALHGALGAARARGVADWLEPRAGLFLWLSVKGVDDVYNMVFHTAFERGLMLVPGQAFQYNAGAPSAHLRLTFSKLPVQHMQHAAHQLVEIIKDEQRSTLEKRPQRLATER